MCCIRINTDVILANIFALQRTSVTIDDLTAYVEFLSKMSPTYVSTDFAESSVKYSVEKYPTLYSIEEKQDGDFVVLAGEKRPNLQFFNSLYSDSWASYLQRITKAYLSHKE